MPATVHAPHVAGGAGASVEHVVSEKSSPKKEIADGGMIFFRGKE